MLYLWPQRSVMPRFCMKSCLMTILLVVLTSGNCKSCVISKGGTVMFVQVVFNMLNCFVRCTSPRGYRLPPCALINISHGARVDHMSHKLTAIVKPQPAAGANFSAHRHLAGLNHSPRSPFIPTQVRRTPIIQPLKCSWVSFGAHFLELFPFCHPCLLTLSCSITTNKERWRQAPRATGTPHLKVLSRNRSR